MLDFDEPTPATAFHNAAAGYDFLGKSLQPFGHLRKTAAINLGLHYWSLSPEDIIESPNSEKLKLTDGTALTDEEREALEKQPDVLTAYVQLPSDVAILLWICSQPDSVAQRARRKPDDYASAIDKFADENQISVGDANYPAALEVFMQILGDVNATDGVPQVKSKGEPPAKN